MDYSLPPGKKIYFASDFHLGVPDYATSLAREKRICAWLDAIQNDAAIIFLVGDLFDAWMEYKTVVPKGFIRFLGKLAALTDKGIRIEAFTGNHDLWMRGYFQSDLNIPVHYQPLSFSCNGKNFFVAHGDGLGPGDSGYKIMKAIISNPFAQWFYRRIHPDTGLAIANWLSKKGPKHKIGKENKFLGAEKEWLIQFSKNKLASAHYDYFLFGHRHIMVNYPLSASSTYINLGDWLTYDSYAVFDGNELSLEQWNPAIK